MKFLRRSLFDLTKMWTLVSITGTSAAPSHPRTVLDSFTVVHPMSALGDAGHSPVRLSNQCRSLFFNSKNFVLQRNAYISAGQSVCWSGHGEQVAKRGSRF